MAAKRNCLTLYLKSKIIEDFEKGVSVTTLSKKYGVAKGTISGIKKKKMEILKAVKCTQDPSRQRNLRKTEFPRMENALYKWYCEQRLRNLPVTTEDIREKAVQLHCEIKESESTFVGSNGWLQRFKKRNNIRLHRTQSPDGVMKRSEGANVMNVPFEIQLAKKMKDLEVDESHVYNVSETLLYWREMPKRNNQQNEERSRELVSVLACANARGSHKLELMVIGSHRDPSELPSNVHYVCSGDAKMSGAIFGKWFLERFVHEVSLFLSANGLPNKAILILDNTPWHCLDSLTAAQHNITLMKFPQNVPNLKTPIEHILWLLKLHFRNNLLESSRHKQTNEFVKSLQAMSLNSMLCLLEQSWRQMEATVISNCWFGILQESTSGDDDADAALVDQLNQYDENILMNSIRQSLNALNVSTFNLNEIRHWNHDFEDVLVDAVSIARNSTKFVGKYTAVTEHVSHEMAVDNFNVIIAWAAQNKIGFREISALKSIRQIALLKQMQSKRKKY